MVLYKNKKYQIVRDGSIQITSGSQPSTISIPITCCINSYNITFFKYTIMEIAWNNINANIWNISMLTIKYGGSSYSIFSSPTIIIPSEDVTISDSADMLVSGAIIITELQNNFDVYFLQSSAEKELVNKQPYLELVKVSTGTLRESSSIINPQITFEWDSQIAPNFNYVYIPLFGRFYYVNEIVFVANNIWVMNLNVDVLMTYKDKILLQTAEIERQENTFDKWLIDDERLVDNGVNITVMEDSSTAQFFVGNDSVEDVMEENNVVSVFRSLAS